MTKSANVVSKAVIDAREILGRAMRSGDTNLIRLAYCALESADHLAKTRRAAMHSTRIAIAIVEKL